MHGIGCFAQGVGQTRDAPTDVRQFARRRPFYEVSIVSRYSDTESTLPVANGHRGGRFPGRPPCTGVTTPCRASGAGGGGPCQEFDLLLARLSCYTRCSSTKKSLILASVFTNIRDDSYDALRCVYHILGSIPEFLSVEAVLDPVLHKYDIPESLLKVDPFLEILDSSLPIEASLMKPSL
jgi:hypothetical protein